MKETFARQISTIAWKSRSSDTSNDCEAARARGGSREGGSKARAYFAAVGGDLKLSNAARQHAVQWGARYGLRVRGRPLYPSWRPPLGPVSRSVLSLAYIRALPSQKFHFQNKYHSEAPINPNLILTSHGQRSEETAYMGLFSVPGEALLSVTF